MWYKNLDKLIHYANQDGRLHVFYSTPIEVPTVRPPPLLPACPHVAHAPHRVLMRVVLFGARTRLDWGCIRGFKCAGLADIPGSVRRTASTHTLSPSPSISFFLSLAHTLSLFFVTHTHMHTHTHVTTQYTEARQQEALAFTTKRDDFFPYADGPVKQTRFFPCLPLSLFPPFVCSLSGGWVDERTKRTDAPSPTIVPLNNTNGRTNDTAHVLDGVLHLARLAQAAGAPDQAR